MNTSIQTDQLILGKHQFGRIDQRMKIGPVTWTFHDLFWVHQGAVVVKFPNLGCQEHFDAPAGVLIRPGTAFSGHAIGSFATASICHFEYAGAEVCDFGRLGYDVVRQDEALHVQSQVRLAMQLAQRNDPNLMVRRQRLLHSILDGFNSLTTRGTIDNTQPENRLTYVWAQATDNLEDMRTLSDVARLAGVSESGFRKQHRISYDTSAGDHLRNLRLTKGEELLATTGFSVSEIAAQIGYRHSETFCTAFKKSRGLSPGQYRRWSKPFA